MLHDPDKAETKEEEIKEEKSGKAKTVSLFIKVFTVVFMITCAVLKWLNIFQNCEIKEICFIGATVGAIFGDISINTALDKFKKGGE
jgi:hypothetical protein